MCIAVQAATGIVQGLQGEAAKAKAVAERHQDMVASLTADNLLFLMRLKKCEGDLVSAVQERNELRLAVEEQKGPWFDEVLTRNRQCSWKAPHKMQHGYIL